MRKKQTYRFEMQQIKKFCKFIRMSKALEQTLSFVNTSMLKKTDLRSKYPDQMWMFPLDNSQSELMFSPSNMNQNYFNMEPYDLGSLESKLYQDHFQSYRGQKQFINPQQQQIMNHPLSLKFRNKKNTKKENRINIPSIIQRYHIIKKSQSLHSDVIDMNIPSLKQQQRFMHINNSECSINSESTSYSTIRQRVKDINWPKNLRPKDRINFP